MLSSKPPFTIKGAGPLQSKNKDLLNFYETVLALRPETEEKQQKEFFKQIKSLIKKFSGALHHVDLLGSRPLANTGSLKGVKRALYFHFSYKAEPQALKEIQRLFRIHDFVLYSHSEKLDSRISLDAHQEAFEEVLKSSKQKEEERLSYIQMKKKKQDFHPPKEAL